MAGDTLKAFQQAVFGLVRRLLPVDGTRFQVYVPWAQLREEAVAGQSIDRMAREYARTFWKLDPMHPSHFEGRDVQVITNSMLMGDSEWRTTAIYQGFYAPHGYFHDCDMFLRQEGRIVAVLTLVRRRAARPFTAAEVALLEALQPFIEFSLASIHMASRVHDRASLAARFGLTAREMDVVEIGMTGASNKVASQHLGVALPTLRTHLQRIYAKVGVGSNAGLMAKVGRTLREPSDERTGPASRDDSSQ